MIFLKTLLFTTALSVFASCGKEVTGSSGGNSTDLTKVMVTTLAGIPGAVGHVDGSATIAKFDGPRQLILDTRPSQQYPNGVLFVADQGYNGLVIRAVDPVTGNVTTYLDRGVLQSIGDIVLDTRVNECGALLITDKRMAIVYQVRQNASGKGVPAIIAGGNGLGDVDGSLHVAQLSGPTGLAIDKAGKIYVFDAHYKTLKKIDVEANTLTKFAGRSSPLGEIQEPVDGIGTDARLAGNISDLALSADGSKIYFVEWEDGSLCTVGVADAKVTTHIPHRPSGYQSGQFSGVSLYYPELVAANVGSSVFYTAVGITSPHGSAIYLADFSKQYVYPVVTGPGQGYNDGNGYEAQFNSISGITSGADGKTLYVSDLYNNVIRKIVRP